jgi:poly-gamma-glutamate capsule biosynthesis protein CapA/YwtB (metallophosphatase superfamily)
MDTTDYENKGGHPSYSSKDEPANQTDDAKALAKARAKKERAIKRAYKKALAQGAGIGEFKGRRVVTAKPDTPKSAIDAVREYLKLNA